ncbi:MAG: phage integrase SAM-like domain-containing protein [Saprospiraceae bacterium]|nr:phage integrase SAM-like domain-containing protein [Saprospiraceae bacterium]MCB9326293.1 phage integrase SAM-like domain-containing protein [Lewinellaceae bacterium]
MRAQVMIWTYKPRKDGTCNIKIYAGYKGDKKYFKTKFHVLPSQFDKNKGLVKRTHPNHLRINAAIGEEKKRILDHIIKPGENLRTLGKEKKESFIDFLVEHRNEIKNGFTDLKQSTARNYTSLITRITQYRDDRKLKDISFEDIDMDFYKDFQKFLSDECNCGLVGFGKHIKVIKTVMRNAQELGLHHNDIYKTRLFKRYNAKPSTKIYLTEDEIKAIEELNLSFDKALDRERDRFLVSYYFLMRYEDSRTIQKDFFFEQEGKHYLKYKQEKTERECIIPVKDKAWEILNKRGFNLNYGSNPQSNRDIKTICALARIDTEVTQGEERLPKWKFVTTHTARRSAATNLALQNVSVKIIADLGGWTDIRTLRIYLRASGLDSALVAKDLEFFK